MKFVSSIIAIIFSFSVIISTIVDTLPKDRVSIITYKKSGIMGNTILVKAGNKSFKAKLESNETATEFKKMLPLTIRMSDLNANEKYYDLPVDLPSEPSKPGKINSGDLMLWGSKTLVVFYESFPTSYSYTKIGKIENPIGLSQALGSGNVIITFEMLPD